MNDNKYHKAIIWLTANMEYNKTFPLSDDQQQIIKEIFIISKIQLPVKPTKGYNYYFNIPDNWETITKQRI